MFGGGRGRSGRPGSVIRWWRRSAASIGWRRCGWRRAVASLRWRRRGDRGAVPRRRSVGTDDRPPVAAFPRRVSRIIRRTSRRERHRRAATTRPVLSARGVVDRSGRDVAGFDRTGGATETTVRPVGVVSTTWCSASGAVRRRPRILRAGHRGGAPAGGFLGLVAAGAESLPVRGGGGSAVGVGSDVVELADRGVAERGSAGLVAGDEEAAQTAVEDPASGLERDEGAGVGAGPQPSQERRRSTPYPLVVRWSCGPSRDVASGAPRTRWRAHPGRDGAVPGDVCRLVVAGVVGVSHKSPRDDEPGPRPAPPAALPPGRWLWRWRVLRRPGRPGRSGRLGSVPVSLRVPGRRHPVRQVRCPGRLPGHGHPPPLHQQVRHQLPVPAGVARGLRRGRRRRQRRLTGDALHHRQQRGQPHHPRPPRPGSRPGAARRPSRGVSPAACGVEGVPRAITAARIARSLQHRSPAPTCSSTVPAQRRRQRRGLPGHDLRAPLRDLPGVQRRERARQVRRPRRRRRHARRRPRG